MALAKPTARLSDVHSRVLRFNGRYMASYVPVEARDHLGLTFGDNLQYLFAQEVVEFKNGQEIGRNIVIGDGPETRKAPEPKPSATAWERPETQETMEPIIIIRRASSSLVPSTPDIKREFDF